MRLDRIDKAEEHYQSALKVLPAKPYVDSAGIASMIEFIAEADPLVAKVKPEMVINHSITQETRRQRLYRSTIETIVRRSKMQLGGREENWVEGSRDQGHYQLNVPSESLHNISYQTLAIYVYFAIGAAGALTLKFGNFGVHKRARLVFHIFLVSG